MAAATAAGGDARRGWPTCSAAFGWPCDATARGTACVRGDLFVRHADEQAGSSEQRSPRNSSALGAQLVAESVVQPMASSFAFAMGRSAAASAVRVSSEERGRRDGNTGGGVDRDRDKLYGCAAPGRRRDRPGAGDDNASTRLAQSRRVKSPLLQAGPLHGCSEVTSFVYAASADVTGACKAARRPNGRRNRRRSAGRRRPYRPRL